MPDPVAGNVTVMGEVGDLYLGAVGTVEGDPTPRELTIPARILVTDDYGAALGVNSTVCAEQRLTTGAANPFSYLHRYQVHRC